MVGELLEIGRKRLAQSPLGLPTREASLLLGHVLGLSEAQVLARSDREVPADSERAFENLLERRRRGEPVAYLFGRREFYGRDFKVDARVLIPRPETEHLVEAALGLPLGDRPRILDLGTGSGCLAITLALELAGSRVVAGDISAAALALASENARTLDAASVRLVASDLASCLKLEAFDLVVSNPPYVGREEEASLSVEVRGYEPHRALFAPGDAASVLRRLAGELSPLRPGAYLLFEIGHLQRRQAEEILARSEFELERIIDDYQGIGRAVVARRS